jgi:DNA mismatch repair protein MutL
MTIKRLPPDVVDLLRAGEVIERPASAVKELVENALDAGATRVEVSIRGGGIDEIRVVDDGAGIAAEDLPLAVEPHATSKIAGRDDLRAISSYGFRGEALAALATAADVEIISRPAGADAARLACGRVEPAAAPPGTTVAARALFARVPARRKFLRTERAEAAAVASVLERYALARPDVRFSLVRDGRESLRTSGAGDLRRAAAEVWGEEAARDLAEVEGVVGEVRVAGLVGPPDSARPTRSHQVFVVGQGRRGGGRPVRDPVIASALAAAFDGLVGRGLHVPAILRIDAPPGFIDANVHPAKAEVRFREPAVVRETVRRSVRARFRAAPPVARWEFGAVGAAVVRGDAEAIVRDAPADPAPDAPARPPRPPLGVEILDDEAAARALPAAAPGLPGVGGLGFRGTLGARYILAAEDDALVLVDAHAAHERVLYERLVAEAARGRPAVQPLLVPARFEPAAEEAAAIEEARADLAAVGIEVEAFGPRAWVVTAVPAVLAGADPVRLAREAAAAVADRGRAESRSISDLIARTACRAAVRTGRPLHQEEASDLLRDLGRADDPTRCPHGRPTIVRLPLSEIDRRFGRT